MDFLFPVIIIFIFFIGSFVMITLHARKISARRALPSRDAYLQQHGSAGCPRCASNEQREFGLDHQHDAKRVVACAACGRELFQFVRDAEAR